ncbi:MAG: hypothetical protein Q4P66_07430 [Actinomycetaceae bacterium]|nr:hypothetical protein [Actinomycetaceae bacterium]
MNQHHFDCTVTTPGTNWHSDDTQWLDELRRHLEQSSLGMTKSDQCCLLEQTSKRINSYYDVCASSNHPGTSSDSADPKNTHRKHCAPGPFAQKHLGDPMIYALQSGASVPVQRRRKAGFGDWFPQTLNDIARDCAFLGLLSLTIASQGSFWGEQSVSLAALLFSLTAAALTAVVRYGQWRYSWGRLSFWGYGFIIALSLAPIIAIIATVPRPILDGSLTLWPGRIIWPIVAIIAVVIFGNTTDRPLRRPWPNNVSPEQWYVAAYRIMRQRFHLPKADAMARVDAARNAVSNQSAPGAAEHPENLFGEFADYALSVASTSLNAHRQQQRYLAVTSFIMAAASIFLVVAEILDGNFTWKILLALVVGVISVISFIDAVMSLRALRQTD